MGGVSSGGLTTDNLAGRSCLRLQGEVSLDNNGGFIQGALNMPEEVLADIEAYRGIVLDVYGNHEEYNVHLRTGNLWLPWQSFRATFTAVPHWQRLYLPFIWGGDLNMRHDESRIEYFVTRALENAESSGGFNEVSSFCVENPDRCEIRIPLASDAPWYETQDLQGWSHGHRISIQPLSMELIFDEPVDGMMLSDHNGVLVRYRLSWAAELTRPF